jgi:hypothetical protein
MQSEKSGRQPADSSSLKDKGLDQKPSSHDSTWPRFDLFPSEHVVSGLRDWGSEVVLKSGYLSTADYAAVREAVKRLCIAETELHALLTQTNETDLRRKLLELFGGIAGAAYVIGAHGAMTDTAQVFFEKSRAAHMRVTRAAGAEEEELRAAIEAVAVANGITIPSENAYKDAGIILSEVNERLSGSRAKPVSVDAIYRRLRPRSLRTRGK